MNSNKFELRPWHINVPFSVKKKVCTLSGHVCFSDHVESWTGVGIKPWTSVWFLVKMGFHRGSTVGFLLLQCSSGVV